MCPQGNIMTPYCILPQLFIVACLADDAIVPCEDEDLLCAEKASKGYCLGWAQDKKDGSFQYDLETATFMLSSCRVSCRRYLNKKRKMGQLSKNLFTLLTNLGGTGDVIKSMFGKDMALCDFSATGWVAKERKIFLKKRYIVQTKFTSKQLGPLRYTELGFQKVRLPEHVRKAIERIHSQGSDLWQKSSCIEPGIFPCPPPRINSTYCEASNQSVVSFRVVSDQLGIYLNEQLTPLVEQWVGGLKMELTYKMINRRYLKGARIMGHRDLPTTVITAVVSVAQDVDGHPWPFNIGDYSRKPHRVFLEPGDMLLFEGARLPHGREEIFRGKHYDTIHIDFKPAWYKNHPEEDVKSAYQLTAGKTGRTGIDF